MNQNGGTTLPTSGVPYGWDVEISLDVQVAHEICQNCKILLVEASSASFANLGKAVNTAVAKGANVVSNSYGSYGASSRIGGTGPSAYDHPGHAIVVAAGDSGFGPSYPGRPEHGRRGRRHEPPHVGQHVRERDDMEQQRRPARPAAAATTPRSRAPGRGRCPPGRPWAAGSSEG